MTRPDRMELLKKMVNEHGQTKVAQLIGKSASTVCQILSGKYQGSPDNVLAKVEEVFGTTTVPCPAMGEIPLGHCAEERRKPFATSRTEMFMACRNCERGGKQ